MVGRNRLASASVALCAAVGMLGVPAAAATELDRSFAGDGTMTLPISRGQDWARAAVLSRDGSILVAADVEPRRGGNNDFAVVRLRDDGTPDPAFGVGGVARVDLAGYRDGVGDLVEQPDGKIVLAGSTSYARARREGYGFVRLLPNGQRDPGFGTNGVVIVPERSFGRYGECPSVNSLALTADGRIVAVGGIGCGGEGGYMELKLAAMRLLPDGNLDPSFHGDGLWSSWAGCYAGAVSVLADGGLLIAGATGSRDYCWAGHMRLIRLRADGAYAADWQKAGRLTIPFPRVKDSAAGAMAIDDQGRVLLAGQADGRLALARVLSDGSLDTRFGTGGRVVSRTGPRRSEYGSGVALAADGTAVVSVHSTSLSGLGGRFMVMRLTADGRLDSGFALGGWQRFPFGVSATASDVVLDTAGRIVAVGSVLARRTRSRYFYDFAAARLR